ncbi:type II toxin-antitoxin system death-on-curing family toxin [Streptosporangium roseum]|uniref:Death-on-curing family protein n=1 Tax=Streptosporangium roseum (strain ATCC 12428 / DSM 43021 / JCM 3005 / KCTC 9067 / NCIMB 10171 / NRRL 2505 / NI 9100) TaxID=479432 RepID=D2B259_STRRD|nr:type II toxin-antitoxin system death-on-curing family toxin [Streptosporangium roseum]ACZ89283.1 death-on-curing family protein [Streptosporangium roseum DSM 43021]
MTLFITLEQGLRIARAAVGGPIQVRDLGLLEAALFRPRTSVFGRDAYPDLVTKAAALFHSIISSHPFVDGNKRAAWLTMYVFCAKNGVTIEPADEDEAYDFVIAVASGKLTEVDEIAEALRGFAVPL